MIDITIFHGNCQESAKLTLPAVILALSTTHITIVGESDKFFNDSSSFLVVLDILLLNDMKKCVYNKGRVKLVPDDHVS